MYPLIYFKIYSLNL